MSRSSHVLASIPLIIAGLYYLLSPFFIRLVRKGLTDYLDKVDQEWQGPKDEIPPHRTSEAIAANIDWVIDAPQMVPALLLPLTAAVFALQNNNTAAIVLSFSVVVICTATLWIYSCSPVEYRSMRLLGYRYTIIALVSIVLNGVSAAVIILK